MKQLHRIELGASARVRSIPADTALGLGKFLGRSRQFWLNLQSCYVEAAEDEIKAGRNKGVKSLALSGTQCVKGKDHLLGAEKVNKLLCKDIICMKRCDWANANILQAAYHDKEWGMPAHDDRKHFEMLILEGAQAGLSWETVLRKREAYRKVFKEFDPEKVARMTDDELEEQLKNPGIIRNRLKVFATRKNALVFLNIQKEFGSFDAYIWRFVDGKPINGKRRTIKDVPANTSESEALSKDLKKRGMSFVGSTIIYAYMQAVGMVNDHLVSCFRYAEVKKLQ